ncbi:MAG: hypothetical protein ACP5JT_03425 [Thermoplasmata archaeon]|jgi:hypothetical protein
MEKPIQEYCLHNRDGMCYFSIAYPTKCNLCFNFVSSEYKIKSKYGINKNLVTLYDIMIRDESFETLFPKSGDYIQSTLEVK